MNLRSNIKYCLPALLGIFLASCLNGGERSDALDDANGTLIVQRTPGERLLSQARKRMREKIAHQPVPGQVPDNNRMEELAALSLKEDYDTLEIARFLDLPAESSKNDAEFSQVYNEVLFRMIDREPNRFVSAALHQSQASKDYFGKQIKASVNDRVNVPETREKFNKEVRRQWQSAEPGIKSNDQQVITKEYNRYQSLNTISGSRVPLEQPRKLMDIRRRDTTVHNPPLQPQVRVRPGAFRAVSDTIHQ